MIIYSCITNGYDVIPDHYYDSDVRYVMFHDGTVEQKGPWEFIKLDVDIKCPRRLSAYPKINPHKYFDNGEDTVWIDGCYKMTKEFVEDAKTRFPFTILRHPNRFSYYDEMLEGFECSFFSYEQGIKLTKMLFECGYNFRKYRSPLGTIIYRKMTNTIIRFGDLWWHWFDKGVNRDQVSFDVALQELGLNPNLMERTETGVPLGHNNKVGRKGKHPRRGELEQWRDRNKFIQEMQLYVGMSRIYAKHDHGFMRGVQ